MPFKLFFFCCTIFSSHAFAQVFPELIPFRSEDRWGYADISGKLIIKPIYDDAGFFIHAKNDTLYNPAARVKLNNQNLIIDTSGKIIVPQGFKKTNDFIIDGMLFFLVTAPDGKKGVFKDGDTIVPVEYSDVTWQRSKEVENEIVFSMKKGTETSTLKHTIDAPKVAHRTDTIAPGPLGLKGSIETTPYYFKREELSELRKKYVLDSIRFIEPGLAYIEKSNRQGVLIFDKLYVFKKRYEIISFDLLAKFSSGCDNKRSKLLMVTQLKDRYTLLDEKEMPLFPGELTDTEANYDYIVARRVDKIGLFSKNICFSAIPIRYDNFIESYQLPVGKGRYFLLFRISLNGKEAYVGQNGTEYFNGL